ncbi:Kunitz/Bovine pancreatic trypsin inhibitor domain protein [Necator americanus]|uniref:Kunitz/Bovine pancreatic trypsin inhibitor domain protein n=1 Tax=Necator americanus TaxID=51031 RepID=W2SHX3_NECAM|nr:Kunitz/Bovine pancreatic trypsin inhibitor domain protein [Necator americanus]ETN69195.1 Kunitz/Bovine pancreatic trypsin inhibitor domain protein [Necator americanus]
MTTPWMAAITNGNHTKERISGFGVCTQQCELLCKPEGGNFYYKWDEKVVDGTKCDAKGEDICVDGVCLPVGCDGKLGSALKVDKCGVCDGDGSKCKTIEGTFDERNLSPGYHDVMRLPAGATAIKIEEARPSSNNLALKVDKCGVCDGDGSKCKTIEGTFDERNLSPGYHDVMRLPAGATAIKIEEARPSSNNLALKNSSEHFFLNGNSMIQVEKDVELNGVHFEYDDSKPERITAKGPLKEDVTVSVLFRKGNRDAAIKYEFSIPLMEDVDYMYKPGEWSSCSVTCGKGVMTRTPYCIDTKSQRRVNDALCDNANYTKPEHEKPCETVDCDSEWFEGDWEPCSQTCGDEGEQYRVVYCHQIFANGRRVTVEDGNCTSERPSVRQVCNRFSCPEWQAGPWSACSEKCGDAFQYRSVTCRSEKEGEEGKLLPAEACDSEKTVESQRSCNLGPCEGLKFFTTDWKLCSKCNDTEETREVTCKDNMGRAYPLEKCLTEEEKEIPSDTRCGGGTQERVAVCLNYDKKPVPEWCDEAAMPVLTQECNLDPCPSQFGCCPDGKTPARGSHKEGCPCQYTRYGCCPDGETTALGPRNDGCDDCRYAKLVIFYLCKYRYSKFFSICGEVYIYRYGCCPDGENKAIGPDYAGCPSTTLAPFLLGGTVAPSKISSCALPQDQGTVCSSGYKLVWYYDTTEGRCSQFWYGGCDGNDNRFATKEQCETICVEPPGIGRCYLPKVEGPLRCDVPQAKYWYDYNTKQCAAFWWRGCHGNANNFGSWEECSTFCKDVGPFEVPTTSPPPSPPQPFVQPVERFKPLNSIISATIEEVCRSTQDSGPCQDYSDQYYYDAYKGTCQTFIYGGCGGNLNRFRTEEECMQRCGFLNPTAVAAHGGHQMNPMHQVKSRQVCHLPLDVGKCQGSFDSWYYEMATGSCVEFKYSGCSGNANRFPSREDCESTCVRRSDVSTNGDSGQETTSICDEIKDTGPCTNFVTKWYYNKMPAHCRKCKGHARVNTNIFISTLFHNNVRNSSMVDVWGTPIVSRRRKSANHVVNSWEERLRLRLFRNSLDDNSLDKSLRAYIPSYYYDYHKGICKEFVYGGCGGNANRFETADECATRCARRQQGRRELSRSFYADESPLEADDNANRNEQLQEVTEEKQPDVHEDDLNDEVLRGIDYDEKKVNPLVQRILSSQKGQNTGAVGYAAVLGMGSSPLLIDLQK